ncbi:MAG: hypothetical protein ABI743_00715 [bacterium]
MATNPPGDYNQGQGYPPPQQPPYQPPPTQGYPPPQQGYPQQPPPQQGYTPQAPPPPPPQYGPSGGAPPAFAPPPGTQGMMAPNTSPGKKGPNWLMWCGIAFLVFCCCCCGGPMIAILKGGMEAGNVLKNTPLEDIGDAMDDMARQIEKESGTGDSSDSSSSDWDTYSGDSTDSSGDSSGDTSSTGSGDMSIVGTGTVDDFFVKITDFLTAKVTAGYAIANSTSDYDTNTGYTSYGYTLTSSDGTSSTDYLFLIDVVKNTISPGNQATADEWDTIGLPRS